MIARKTHLIDATDRVLGRLASEVAALLHGKNKPDFSPYKDIGDFVIIKNVKNLKITGRKMKQKEYFRHSGFLGGVRLTPFKKLFKENPAEVFKKAVYGMLPKNKLRTKMIKRLKILNAR